MLFSHYLLFICLLFARLLFRIKLVINFEWIRVNKFQSLQFSRKKVITSQPIDLYQSILISVTVKISMFKQYFFATLSITDGTFLRSSKVPLYKREFACIYILLETQSRSGISSATSCYSDARRLRSNHDYNCRRELQNFIIRSKQCRISPWCQYIWCHVQSQFINGN